MSKLKRWGWEHEAEAQQRWRESAAQSELQRLWGPPEEEQARRPQVSQGNNPQEEFVFQPVQVENLGMIKVFTGLQNNWEELRSGYFISTKENFLSGVFLVGKSSIDRGLKKRI